MNTEPHEFYMRRAIELARRGWGLTHPNPQVGALIVEDGAIVAEGFHAAAGGPHAEINVLQALGRPPQPGAVLYVTLEPCSTEGKTGSCTQAIIQAGIRRVVTGATDPNPVHAGRGYEMLRAAGVEVTAGVLSADCADLNLIFSHWITTGRPLIAAKSAVTLDGKVATRTGESKWITNEAARTDGHRWRRYFPAIAVGAGTVRADNPRLTARLDGEEWCPIRFVFDGLLRTVTDKALPNVYTDDFRERTIVVTTPHGGLGYVRKLQAVGVKVWVIPSATARVGFGDFSKKCAEEGITGVFFEAGPQLTGQLLSMRAVDYLFVYRAPVLLADEKAKSAYRGLRTERLDQSVRLEQVRHASLGDDQLMRGYVVYPPKINVDETTVGMA